MGVAGTTDIGEQTVLNFMNVHHCRTCQQSPVCALLASEYVDHFQRLDLYSSSIGAIPCEEIRARRAPN